MRLKIQGGTVQHDSESLCSSCRHATIVKGRNLGDEIVECGRLTSGHNWIRFRVSACSDYADRRRASLREMEEIAWVLRTDANRKPIGFVKAGDLKSKDRYVLPDDDD